MRHDYDFVLFADDWNARGGGPGARELDPPPRFETKPRPPGLSTKKYIFFNAMKIKLAFNPMRISLLSTCFQLALTLNPNLLSN